MAGPREKMNSISYTFALCKALSRIGDMYTKETFSQLKKGAGLRYWILTTTTDSMSYFNNDPQVVEWLATVSEASRRSGGHEVMPISAPSF